jgi:hypothetical protein
MANFSFSPLKNSRNPTQPQQFFFIIFGSFTDTSQHTETEHFRHQLVSPKILSLMRSVKLFFILVH